MLKRNQTMARDEQLRAARDLLGLPHPADKDEVTAALRYIEFRDRNFQATRRRYSKAAKLAAGRFLNAAERMQKAGLPLPSLPLLQFYKWVALSRGYLGQPGLRPQRAEGVKVRFALEQAFWLLSERNRPCRASRSSEWCELAAILLGMPEVTAGLVSQARRVQVIFKRQNMRPGTK